MSIFAELRPSRSQRLSKTIQGEIDTGRADFKSAAPGRPGRLSSMMQGLPPSLRARGGIAVGCAALLLALSTSAGATPGNYPITPQQRATAQHVADAGVPLSELAADAPDSYTVVRGDTLWAISKLFLKSPWRWPELWGMNLQEIHNPHLIYPGQVLVLEKVNGRARLRVAGGDEGVTNGTVKLEPHVRSAPVGNGAIPSIPLHLITPFLNEAVVFDTNALQDAPRIVAVQEGHVNVSRGDTVYVRGDLGGGRNFRVFRTPQPLTDPSTGEVLGYEAAYVGTAELLRAGGSTDESGKSLPVPDTFTLTDVRQEAGVGDRLAPLPERDFSTYVPHAPEHPIAGQIVSIYGEGLNAGQNQIVAINRGKNDGVERGDVLALWRDGAVVTDPTSREQIKLPDERHGLLFVFSVFDRVSYALILSVQEPVKRGDRFTQP
jgi:hypothetical protein